MILFVSHHYVTNKSTYIYIYLYVCMYVCMICLKPFHSTNHCCLSLNMNRIYKQIVK